MRFGEPWRCRQRGSVSSGLRRLFCGGVCEGRSAASSWAQQRPVGRVVFWAILGWTKRWRGLLRSVVGEERWVGELSARRGPRWERPCHRESLIVPSITARTGFEMISTQNAKFEKLEAEEYRNKTQGKPRPQDPLFRARLFPATRVGTLVCCRVVKL